MTWRGRGRGVQADFVDAYVASLSEVHQRLAAKPDGLDVVAAKIRKAQAPSPLSSPAP